MPTSPSRPLLKQTAALDSVGIPSDAYLFQLWVRGAVSRGTVPRSSLDWLATFHAGTEAPSRAESLVHDHHHFFVYTASREFVLGGPQAVFLALPFSPSAGGAPRPSAIY
jgi:hypothetical protein